jgi:hypothetical protein
MPYGVDRLIDLKRQASKPHRVSCIGAVVALSRLLLQKTHTQFTEYIKAILNVQLSASFGRWLAPYR